MHSAALKRTFDVVLAAAGLVILSPVMAIIALAIRLADRGPVLFTQERIGLRFEPFMMYKFRTRVAADGSSRITPWGGFLRRTKLDQLPQLFNVLRGEMSLVGPRPELRDYVRLYRHDFVDILAIRPGITDLASILHRDESRIFGNAEDPEGAYVRRILPEKIRLAREYVRRSSVAYDLWLLTATVGGLLYPRAAVERAFDWAGRRHRTLSAGFQVLVALAAHMLAVDFRFEGRVPSHQLEILRQTLPVLLGLRLAALVAFGLHRNLWRYADLRDVRRIVSAVTLSSVVFWVTLTQVLGVTSYSRAVFLADALLCVLFLAGVRLGRRMHHGMRERHHVPRRVLVVGSGEAVERVLGQIAREPEYEAIGVVDDDPRMKGVRFHDVPVLGTQQELGAIIAEQNPDAVVVEAASVPVERRREIAKICATLEMPITTVPGFRELLAAKPSASNVSRSEIRHLLARSAAPSQLAGVENFLRGRRILVTGAAGAIGSELCHQAAACGPALLVLFDRDAARLDALERQFRRSHPDLPMRVVVGDVTDVEQVAEVLEETQPYALFHAAAHTHVALMERNAAEAFKTNLVGTRITAEAARRHDVAVYVLVSSDQAVDPGHVVGVSRRAAELTVAGMTGVDGTRFLVVRIGTLLESSGGMLERIKQQIEDGGPVTLAHADQTRLFITRSEAAHLILQAGTMGAGGEVFVLDMGKPVRVLEMAHTLIRMYGHTPGRDIEVVFTGLGPGERLFEKLFDDHETVWKTAHPRILMALNGAGTPAGRERIRTLMKSVEQRMRSGHAADAHATLVRALD